MLTMRLAFLLALYFLCVSSNDENLDDICENETLNARLGSSVLLPCIFSTNNHNWVSWTHTAQMEYLVHLHSKGQINFTNPRDGRIKVYPNQGSDGNYSISIDELKSSDLGGYRCKHRHQCVQVDLRQSVTETGTNGEILLLIFICVGVAAFILLSVGGYGCMKGILWCCKRTQDYTVHVTGAGVSAPPMEIGIVPDDHQRGADNLVYENDDQGPVNQQVHGNHPSMPGAWPGQDTAQPTQSTTSIYPNLEQCNFERMESQRKKQRFHTELFSRLRQASVNRHFYANQGEIARQQAMSTQAENQRKAGLEKKKAKEKCEYKNPIYNRSTDHLNHL